MLAYSLLLIFLNINGRGSAEKKLGKKAKKYSKEKAPSNWLASKCQL